MSDDGKCYAATPATTLEEHILNSNIAKSDTEWWAHHEIARLRADLASVTAERDRMRDMLKPMAYDIPDHFDDDVRISIGIKAGDIRRARAALEGVTEKERVGNE